MKRTAPRLAPQSFRSLFSDGVSTGLTDRELLERFAASRDSAGELAFATLVARHGPMVLSVCRRMLRDPHESEDAFQATFLVLVRKRSGIRIDASLGPWLYGVSVRVARRVRNHASRRRWFELDESIAEPAVEPNATSDRDLRFAIDDFLAELPANYRAAIVLCYLEGLTHEEAASRLRCPVGTVRSRLARGRAILKKRLARAGLAPASRQFDAAEPFETNSGTGGGRPSTGRLDRPVRRQTCPGRAPPSNCSNPDRRTCNWSDPNHDDFQARGGGFVGPFLRHGGLGCSRTGCPDTRRRESRNSSGVSFLARDTHAAVAHRIRAFFSGRDGSAQRSGRGRRSCRSPTTYRPSSSKSSPKSAPPMSIPRSKRFASPSARR